MANFDQAEFAENPETRCPCVLLLDTSGSMYGEPIEKLNEGLQIFKQTLEKDPLALLRVEIAIVTFGPVFKEQDFISAANFTPPVLSADGDTPLGEAILMGLDMIQERKKIYKENGIPYYRPWLFLITDGAPNSMETCMLAAERIRMEEDKKGTSFFAVGVEGADMEVLAQISKRPPLMLKGINFKDLFRWLSNSMTKVSQSQIEDKVKLDEPTWGYA